MCNDHAWPVIPDHQHGSVLRHGLERDGEVCPESRLENVLLGVVRNLADQHRDVAHLIERKVEWHDIERHDHAVTIDGAGDNVAEYRPELPLKQGRIVQSPVHVG
jgi:hypothetical protein